MKRVIFLVMLMCLSMGVCEAQNSRKVKALQGQKAELQKKLKKSQEELNRTQKKVKTGRRISTIWMFNWATDSSIFTDWRPN